MRAGEKFPCAVLLAILGGRTAVSEEKYQRPSPVLRRRRLVSRNSEAGTKRTGSLRIVRRMANRAVMGNSVGGRKPDAVRLGRLSLKCVEKTLLQKHGACNRFDCLGGTVGKEPVRGREFRMDGVSSGFRPPRLDSISGYRAKTAVSYLDFVQKLVFSYSDFVLKVVFSYPDFVLKWADPHRDHRA